MRVLDQAGSERKIAGKRLGAVVFAFGGQRRRKMTRTVTLTEARVKLSRLVEEASAGVETVITKNGKPVAGLTALAATSGEAAGPRQFGLWRDLYGYRAPDSIGDTDPEFEALFNDPPVFPNEDR